MPDYLDLIPLARETVDRIRARMDADANAGLAPDDPSFIDQTPGGFWDDFAQVFALEAARLWDFAATEVVAACLLPYSWGDYLDYHGEVYGLPRKDAAAATGEVTFTGPGATIIPAGAQVATLATSPDVDPQQFEVIASAQLPNTPATPANVIATPTPGTGTLAAGTYFYRVSALNASGESAAAAEVSAVLSATGEVTLGWNAVAGATSYRVYRGAAGAEVLLASPATNSYTDNGSATPGSGTPSGDSVASLSVAVQASDAGAAGNVAANTIDALLTPIEGIQELTNPSAITGGADVEDDDLYKARLLQALQSPQGGGSVGDYVRWVLAWPGVGHVTVVPAWAGPNTVSVSITDVDNAPVSASLVTAVQEYLDPSPGAGLGQAPVGAVVTVTTPAEVNVPVDATPAYQAGFSTDGAGGTQALRADINAAVAAYFATLGPGDDVILAKVIAAIVDVGGVANVTLVKLNGVAADFAVDTTHVAAMPGVTIH